MKIEKLKNLYWLIGIITSILILIISNTWKLSKYHEKIDNSYNEILIAIKTNEQMSLKSIIWNESIPLSDRINACDTYIKRGYNSVTKKHCEIALNNYNK